jgi:hypothetical protein
MSVDAAVAQLNTAKVFPVDLKETETMDLDEMADTGALPKSIEV